MKERFFILVKNTDSGLVGAVKLKPSLKVTSNLLYEARRYTNEIVAKGFARWLNDEYEDSENVWCVIDIYV